MPPKHPLQSARALISKMIGAMHFPLLISPLLIYCGLVLSVGTPWLSAAEPGKAQVLFLPFSIEITGPYEHLQNGLPSVLAGRLASRANITAISRTGSEDQLARALKSGEYMAFSNQLRQSGADYLILGALQPTSASTFELTCHVFTATPGEPPEKFTLPFGAVEEVMTAIDNLAWEISGAVFAKPRPESQIAAPGGDDMFAFQSAHPERAYRQGRLSSSTPGLESEGRVSLVSSLQGRKIPVQVMDINTDDLNGDGSDEILLLTSNSLLIYREVAGQFQKIDEIELPGYLRYLSVTTADFNENGIAEIYIAGSNGDIPATTVHEWNGQDWRSLWADLPWYLRVMDGGTAPPVLLGQKTPGAGPIQVMQLDPRQGVRPQRELTLPQDVNLYDFAQADITGNGSPETIAIGTDYRMRVYNAAGTLLWTSTDIHGASNNFFGTLSSTAQTGRESDPETVYIKTRIVVQDLDGDGINEILVGRNRLETVPFMPNLRYFDGGSIAAYKWEEGGLIALWETKKTPGYIVNYQLSPAGEDANRFQLILVDGDGSSPFFFWRSPSSRLTRLTMEVQKSL